MSTKIDERTMSLGGGGASAPTAHEEPMIAPGTYRPDWPTPEYAKLPWQKKLHRLERYADELEAHERHETAPAYRKVIDCLSRFTKGQQLDADQLIAALALMESEHTQDDLWKIAVNVDDVSVRGQIPDLRVFEASEILTKLTTTAG